MIKMLNFGHDMAKVQIGVLHGQYAEFWACYGRIAEFEHDKVSLSNFGHDMAEVSNLVMA